MPNYLKHNVALFPPEIKTSTTIVQNLRFSHLGLALAPAEGGLGAMGGLALPVLLESNSLMVSRTRDLRPPPPPPPPPEVGAAALVGAAPVGVGGPPARRDAGLGLVAGKGINLKKYCLGKSSNVMNFLLMALEITCLISRYVVKTCATVKVLLLTWLLLAQLGLYPLRQRDGPGYPGPAGGVGGGGGGPGGALGVGPQGPAVGGGGAQVAAGAAAVAAHVQHLLLLLL